MNTSTRKAILATKDKEQLIEELEQSEKDYVNREEEHEKAILEMDSQITTLEKDVERLECFETAFEDSKDILKEAIEILKGYQKEYPGNTVLDLLENLMYEQYPVGV